MQTFLPFDDFKLSAEILDNKRLGKQRVETLQILKAIVDNEGWIHHPASNMWRGHSNMLALYGMAICDEWTRRGFSDTCKIKIQACYDVNGHHRLPPWFGLKDFHASHRSNLLRKDGTYYCKFGWSEPVDLPYCWPININGKWWMRFKHAGAAKYELDKAYAIPPLK